MKANPTSYLTTFGTSAQLFPRLVETIRPISFILRVLQRSENKQEKMSNDIPMVDLADIGLHHLDKPRESTVDRVANELDSAFSTVGFVYLKNHGVEQQTIDNVFQASKSFFQLPDAIKDVYRCGKPDSESDGYTGKDQEILDVSSLHEIRESYDVASPDGIYPDQHAPEFRKAINKLAPQLSELTTRLLKCMALALDLEEDFFSSRHQFMFHGAERNRTIFRSLYYPTLSDTDIQPGVVRCGAHSDYGAITLLLQDDMGGLEVLSKGEWIPATPIRGTILVNLGDLMQFWTSDRYVATVHRVLVPEEEVRRRSTRQSIAFFVHADNGVMISPIDGSEKHIPVEALAYLKSRISATYK